MMEQQKQTSGFLAYIGRMPIFRKIFAGIAGLLLFSVILTLVVTVITARQQLYDHIRSDIATRAAMQRDEVAFLLLRYTGFVHAVAENEGLVMAAKEATLGYATADPESSVQALDAEWATLTDSSDLVKAVTLPEGNAAVAQLFAYGTSELGQMEIVLTDRYGAVIAATYRPEHYAQTQSLWWQAFQSESAPHIYIGEPMPIPAMDWDMALSIAMPLSSLDQKEPVGFIYVLLDAATLSALLDTWGPTEAIWGNVIGTNRTVIVGRDVNKTMGSDMTEDWFAFPTSRQVEHWAEVPFGNGVMALVGDAALADADLVRGEDDPLANLDWLIFVYRSTRDAYRPVRRVTNAGLLVSIVLCGLTISLGSVIARVASVPAVQLQKVVAQEASGDQNIIAWIYAEDELGQVARGLNRLLAEKKSLRTLVSQRDEVQEQVQARRQRDIAATAAVGDVVAATLDIEQLAQAVVDLLRERFNLYFVGLFLMNESQTRAVLQAGTGESGASLLARGYRVQVGESLIGECVTSREAQMDCALAQHEAARVPELPYAQSEMALPLRSRGEMLGALWVLSYHTDTFDDEMAIVLQTIADQIAVAVDSMRLFSESQEATTRLQQAYRDATRDAWRELTRTRGVVGAGYEARLTGAKRTPSATPDMWRTESRRAWEEGQLVSGDVLAEDEERYLALPITSRDEVIGVMNVSKPVAFGDWTVDELAQLEALTVQLGIALENARLYEEAQNRALRQRMMTEASSRIRASLDMEDVLQAAVKEMRASLGLEFAEVRLRGDLVSTDGERG